jgi:hypothetical protein
MPKLVGGQPMHIREDIGIIDKESDDRGAQRFSVQADLVVDVRLQEENVLGGHGGQVPQFNQLIRAWTNAHDALG